MTADDIIIIIIMTDRRRHRVMRRAFCAHGLVVFIVIRGCCTIEIADMKTIYKKKRKKKYYYARTSYLHNNIIPERAYLS